ncbi:MAG: hypothetical protein ACREYE_11915 [Gammaproteobacteria bacterium]
MKTTLEIPDDLMRAVKIRAVESNQKLKDFIADALRKFLVQSQGVQPKDPLQALRERLIFHPDGSVTNPDGIDDPAFFEALEDIRRRSRFESPRNPFAEN